uniref:Uncharacterized protein n=1 Tax=Solanum tuberosum TaxID=4113 RepID=M1DZX8_SOLTU
MKFSELKLHAMNAVKSYFNRNWGREDLMKSGKVNQETLDILNAGTAAVILFLGYFVVYTQELLYDVLFEDIDFINRALTVFFNLPAIVLHAARVCLPFGAKVDQNAD